MAKTSIEWTEMSWNPVSGCTKVSSGCRNCYAETIANRFWGERKFTDVRLHPERLEIPLHWKKPRRVFVNSMSDLFHEDVPHEFIDKVFAVMGRTQNHTYQILTKRPERMFEYISDPIRYKKVLSEAYLLDAKYLISDEQLGEGISNPNNAGLPNVQLGISAENQETLDLRAIWLLKTPAAVRFVSYEPALGPVDFLHHYLPPRSRLPLPRFEIDGELIVSDLNWVIAGCESGQNARPAQRDWFRSVRDQCQEAGVPFFLKQMVVNGKLTKIPELDGKVWGEYPEAK